ncbi:hypothetical protein [Vulcaniibacterium gelatinicum]|uniref:hypothetical protein n=1 Tax=Vulcaniibacterium gelatinicum TaxID=2598725 RepID=UPI0011C805F2|nr:hypothetical protein [Vulcaniibacterium gelatinicum]
MITRLAIIGTWFAALLSAPALAQCPSPLPPFLSFGIADEALHEHIVIPPARPGDETWQAKLRTQGGTDIYVQNVCLNPGFSSGWHLHPGFLVLTVAEGTVRSSGTTRTAFGTSISRATCSPRAPAPTTWSTPVPYRPA